MRISAAQLVEIIDLLREPVLKPRYNIFPTQPVAAVRVVEKQRELSSLHWGLIPAWAKDAKMGARMINARAETVNSKPSFRSAFRRRRCLIPADGFYEWKKTESRTKQPFYIRMRDESLFAFAGLWERWTAADGSEIESCCIITTEPNDLLGSVHDRMPVILPATAYQQWLDPAVDDPNELQAMLASYPGDEMACYPVSTLVNNPRNDTPACIEQDL